MIIIKTIIGGKTFIIALTLERPDASIDAIYHLFLLQKVSSYDYEILCQLLLLI